MPLQGGLQIRGGHNVIIVGGEIDLTVPCSHSQAVRIDDISGCEAAGNHSDVFQPWFAGNAKVHVDRFTGVSNCQGLEIDPDLA